MSWEGALQVAIGAGLFGLLGGVLMPVVAALAYEARGKDGRMSARDVMYSCFGFGLVFGVAFAALATVGFALYALFLFPLATELLPSPGLLIDYLTSHHRLLGFATLCIAALLLLSAVKLPRAFTPASRPGGGGVAAGFQRLGIVAGLVVAVPIFALAIVLGLEASGAVAATLGVALSSLAFLVVWMLMRGVGWLVQGFTGGA